ncbi:MAG TPA: ferritin-like domain-containing protein [Frankiaceae bacterium]|nr:ferritin-like domain-containing protein [Frankiaceae bacterium]
MERELRAMTAQMNEMHEETFPKLRESLGDFGADLRRTLKTQASSRRAFLVGGGTLLGAVALAACSDGASPGSSGTSATTTPSATPSAANADLSALATNASLENLAVFAYGQALMDTPKGKFGKSVPPAIAEFAKHAKAQHTDHAKAFNAALTKAGGQPFTKPDPALAGPVTEMYGKVNDLPGLAKLALTLENTAAATYTKQMGELTSPEAIAAVATIAPVERQHAAILLYVLGEYPVPDTFVPLGETATSLGARPSNEAGV